MKYKIDFESNPKLEDTQLLCDGISEHAKSKKGHKPISFFAFFIRDENGKMVGGCNGDICYGCFFVGQLWVTEALRHQGYGTKLMTLAEDHARLNHCPFMAVNTFDWEGLAFYKKLGFHVEFERHGFDKDSVFYFLRKNL